MLEKYVGCAFYSTTPLQFHSNQKIKYSPSLVGGSGISSGLAGGFLLPAATPSIGPSVDGAQLIEVIASTL